MIYAALLLVLIAGIILAFTMFNDRSGVPSSGYTYLKYKDGIYIGTEKSEYGNIKAEVSIEKAKIKDIKLLEFPAKFIDENAALKDEIPKMIYDVLQTQNTVAPRASTNSAYALNKVLKAVRNALDQSLIGS